MGCSESHGIEASKPVSMTEPFPKAQEREDKFDPSSKTLKNIDEKEVTKMIFSLGQQSRKGNSIKDQQLEQIYKESEQNLQKFLLLIEEKLSIQYMALSEQTFEMLNEKKLSNTEAKLLIAEEILYTSLNVLKMILEKTHFQEDLSLISKFNKLQIAMLGYMKMKYPRGAKSTVSPELQKKFKDFSMVEEPENDILREAKIYFDKEDSQSIIYKLRTFFNLLIDELESKFPLFQELMEKRVFIISENQKDYTVNHKIGRKIPENISKFPIQDDDFMEIQSPEIFRVIIKWVDDMEDYLLNPTDEVLEKSNFKLVSLSDNNQLSTDEINPDEVQDLLPTLEKELLSHKDVYKNQLKSISKDIELFNSNLIKILTQAERNQKFIPKRQAEIIKYSMYNTKLLSWMLMEKLLIVLKKLITVGKSMKKITLMSMDLIKFNVTDLMRSMMTGNKQEIIKVYENVKELEKRGVIKIIKIKNRLSTHLNDVMIIFKMNASFIICELQLVLTEGYEAPNLKSKNIETLNHFFYELERSPYGVMFELAVLLGFKDHKVSFESKISFNKLMISLDQCEKNHLQSIQVQEFQRKPFICTRCTNYFNPYDNRFCWKICRRCNTNICVKCLIEINPTIQKQFYRKAIRRNVVAELKRLDTLQDLFLLKAEVNEKMKASQISSPHNVGKMMELFNLDKNFYFLRDINGKVGKLNKKKMERFLENSEKQIKSDLLIIVGLFLGQELHFYSLIWNYERKFISYGFSAFSQERQIKFRYFDFAIIRPLEIPYVPGRDTKSNLMKKNSIQIVKSYDNNRTQFMSFIKIELNSQMYHFIFSGTNDHKQYVSEFKNTNFKVQGSNEGFKRIQEIPDLQSMRENLDFPNSGLNQNICFVISHFNWKKTIKNINFYKNWIQDPTTIFENLVSLQKINLSCNQITKISFPTPLPKIRKIILSQNHIASFSGLKNITSVEYLILTRNKLREFNQEGNIKFPNLRKLDLNDNCLLNANDYTLEVYPNLKCLIFTLECMDGPSEKPQLFRLPKLTILHIYNPISPIIRIERCDQLEDFKMSEGVTNEINFSGPLPLLKSLLIFNTPIQSHDILCKELPALKNIQLFSCLELEELPELQMEQVEQINLDSLFISDITKLKTSRLLKLKKLSLGSCCFQSVPCMNLPELQTLELLNNSSMKDFSQFYLSALPSLETLSLGTLMEDVQIPSIDHLKKLKSFTILGGRNEQPYVLRNDCLEKFQSQSTIFSQNLSIFLPKVKNISFNSCCFTTLKTLSKWDAQSIEQLSFEYCYFEGQDREFPQLSLPSLLSLQIRNMGINKIENLALCEFPKLRKIVIQYPDELGVVPLLNFPELRDLKIVQGALTDTSNLSLSSLKNLVNLDLQCQNFDVFPVLDCPKLVRLDISFSNVNDVSNLQHSNIQSLQTFQIQGNEIVKWGNMNLPKVTSIPIKSRHLNDLNFLSKGNLDGLETIDIQNSKLIITIFPQLSMLNLKELSIQDTNIDNIDFLAKSTLMNLKIFTLKNNLIKRIPALKFPELQVLRFNAIKQSGNESKINDISQLEFSLLPKLTRIQIEYNNIEELPRMNFPLLKQIFAMENSIRSIEKFLQSDLPKLSLVNFYDNPLTQFPLNKKISPSEIYMKHARVLDFEPLEIYASEIFRLHYNASTLPAKLPKMKFSKANRVQFQNCGLVNIDQFLINDFPELEEISFVDNKIESVPKIICPKLKRFFVNRNKIKDVSELMTKSNMLSVDMISLQSNCITDIVDFPFTSPKQIFLSHNFITDLSCMSKYRYDNLIMLVVFNCKLAKIPSLKAPICQKIYYNQNQLTSESIKQMQGCELPQLTLLQLQKNKIDSLKSFKQIDLPSLSSLFLMDNSVKHLCSLSKFTQINTLNISGNPLQGIGDFVEEKISNHYLTLKYHLRADLVETEAGQKIQYDLSDAYPYSEYLGAV